MSRLFGSAAPRALVAALAFAASGAMAQAPSPGNDTGQNPGPATPAAPAPSSPAPAGNGKPAVEEQSEADALRIRGAVASVDERGVVVQLSQGINLRVDIGDQAPVFSATRIKRDELKGGVRVSVRTRAAALAGENPRAAEVLSIMSADGADAAPFPGSNASGIIKLIDLTETSPVLVIVDGTSVRRLTVTDETTFWRLQPASLNQVREGASISVLVSRDKSGEAAARRVVFGSPPPGAMLPL